MEPKTEIPNRIISRIIKKKKGSDISSFLIDVLTKESPIHEIARNHGIRFYTSDGKPMFPGALAFELHQTYGFHLAITIEVTASMGFAIDWFDFLNKARSIGWLEYEVWGLFDRSLNDCLITPEQKISLRAGMRRLIVETSPHIFGRNATMQ